MMKRIPSDWLLRLTWACPAVIFVCMLIGWRLSNRLYTDVDGAFARWNFVDAFEWGHWFDLAIFNPFAGLGSTFWSNTPWLNPGAWALQLPFSPLATVTLSYLAQLAAYALTLYWLGRRAGVSRLAAVYALGLFILFNLPPFNYFWGFITPYPIAPFLLVTAAAGNLILLALVIAAEPHDLTWPAKALAAGLAGLIWGIYASALPVRPADRRRFPRRPAAVLAAPACAVRSPAAGRRGHRRRIRGERHAGLSRCLARHLR